MYLTAALKMAFDLLSLYMHELALHSDGSNEHLQPPFTSDVLQEGIASKGPLSPAHINALSACISAINGLFQTFLDMDVFAIRCLPVFNFVRVAYGVVVLVKLYFAASSPSSELGHVISRDNMRVLYYLEALLDKFRACGADEKCRPASKFLLVLVMLRSWFVKMGKGDPRQDAAPTAPAAPVAPAAPAARQAAPGPASDASTADSNPPPALQQLPPPTPAYDHPPNTPLQVLSEVAMGREPTTPRPFYGGSAVGANPAPPPPAFYRHTASTAPSSASSGPAYPPLWMDQQQQQQQQQPLAVPDWSFNTLDFPPGFDFENLGVPVGDSLDAGAMMVFNDSLFGDVFQQLPDPNAFF